MIGGKSSTSEHSIVIVIVPHSLEISDTNKLGLQMSDKNSFWLS